jgi:hypothetical protein
VEFHAATGELTTGPPTGVIQRTPSEAAFAVEMAGSAVVALFEGVREIRGQAYFGAPADAAGAAWASGSDAVAAVRRAAETTAVADRTSRRTDPRAFLIA